MAQSRDWRATVTDTERGRLITKLSEVLKAHGQQNVADDVIREVAVTFENRVYTAATSKDNYIKTLGEQLYKFGNKNKGKDLDLQLSLEQRASRPPFPVHNPPLKPKQPSVPVDLATSFQFASKPGPQIRTRSSGGPLSSAADAPSKPRKQDVQLKPAKHIKPLPLQNFIEFQQSQLQAVQQQKIQAQRIFTVEPQGKQAPLPNFAVGADAGKRDDVPKLSIPYPSDGAVGPSPFYNPGLRPQPAGSKKLNLRSTSPRGITPIAPNYSAHDRESTFKVMQLQQLYPNASPMLLESINASILANIAGKMPSPVYKQEALPQAPSILSSFGNTEMFRSKVSLKNYKKPRVGKRQKLELAVPEPKVSNSSSGESPTTDSSPKPAQAIRDKFLDMKNKYFEPLHSIFSSLTDKQCEQATFTKLDKVYKLLQGEYKSKLTMELLVSISAGLEKFFGPLGKSSAPEVSALPASTLEAAHSPSKPVYQADIVRSLIRSNSFKQLPSEDIGLPSDMGSLASTFAVNLDGTISEAQSSEFLSYIESDKVNIVMGGIGASIEQTFGNVDFLSPSDLSNDSFGYENPNDIMNELGGMLESSNRKAADTKKVFIESALSLLPK